MEPFFGIRIATYRRAGGTYHLLHRCLKSIVAQTWTKWKVFLIGDHYDPGDEFDELSAVIPPGKIVKQNLAASPERSKHSGNDLWKVAGFTAAMTGLKMIQQEKLVHAPLDDDDWWMPDHLQTLAHGYIDFPDAVFVYTQSTHKGGVLPSINVNMHYDNATPRAYCLVHSAASWDTARVPISYRNIIEDRCNYAAGDAEMWDRMRDYCWQKGLKTLYIPKLTVRHDCEQGTKAEPTLL